MLFNRDKEPDVGDLVTVVVFSKIFFEPQVNQLDVRKNEKGKYVVYAGIKRYLSFDMHRKSEYEYHLGLRR